jgi:hypothetical protein
VQRGPPGLKDAVRRGDTLFGQGCKSEDPLEARYWLNRLPDRIHVGGVLGKDWKSWLLGLPSFPIKNLRRVEAENARLWKMWNAERKHASLDHQLRLSRWFEEANFFADESGVGHDDWICKTHLARLHLMFEIAGFEPKQMESSTDDTWLSQALIDLNALTSSSENAAISRRRYHYFGDSRKHFLFRWLVQELVNLSNGKATCPGGFECNNLGNAAECHRNPSYKNLKRVLCKLRGNKGNLVRFGFRRMQCLLSAASGKNATLSRTVESLEGICASEDDPSLSIANFVDSVNILNKRNGGPSVNAIDINVEKVKEQADVEVVIGISPALNQQMGGADCLFVVQEYEKVPGFAVISRDIFGKDKIVFHFSVSETNGRFKIEGPLK